MNSKELYSTLRRLFSPSDRSHCLVLGSAALVLHSIKTDAEDIDVFVNNPKLLMKFYNPVVGFTISPINGALSISHGHLDLKYDQYVLPFFDRAVKAKYGFLLASPADLENWYCWLYQHTRCSKHLAHLRLATELWRLHKHEVLCPAPPRHR